MGIFDELKSKFLGDKSAPLKTIQSGQEQTPEEMDLVAHIRQKIDSTRNTNSRVATEGIYLTNVAYLLGFSGVYYDTTYRQFKNIDPRRKLTRNYFKVNKILPTIQNRLARITKNPPKWDVRPESSSQDDKDSARLGVQIIETILEKQRFGEKRQDQAMTAMQGGVSYIQVLWDPTLGKPMIDPETGEMSGYEGDVRLEVLNLLEIFSDPLAKSLEDAEWIIKAKVRKLEYFKQRYPERGHLVKEEDAWLLSSLYDMKSNALTSVGIVGASTEDQSRHAAIELVYYEKRSEKYPNGRMVCCASGILLEDKEMPIGQYDIVKFDDIMIGGRYNSEAVITHMRPVQDQINVLRARMADYVRKLLAGKYIAAKGAGLIQEALNDDPSGEVIQYNPVPGASEPKAMDVPQMPPYAYKEIDALDRELDYISGINEVSRGSLPSASIPAAGMAFLQEQDETRVAVEVYRNEIGYAKMGENILRYVGKYYHMPRVLKIAGEGMGYTVKEFMGKDLRDNFDVIVMPGSTMPSNKVLKRQDILNAYQMGLLGDPLDPVLKAKVLKAIEFGDVSEIWKDQALDDAQIKQEIQSIEMGQMPEFNAEFDNHKAHLVELNRYRKSERFKSLGREKQDLFLFVMDMHLKAIVNLENPQLEQQKNMAQQGIQQAPQAQQLSQEMLAEQHPGSDLNMEPQV